MIAITNEYERGDPWPCPACSDSAGTPEVDAVDGEFVWCDTCGEKWHAPTRMADTQLPAYKHVQDVFPAGDTPVEAGEWVRNASTVLSIVTESDELLDAIDHVPDYCKIAWSGSDFHATAAFSRTELIRLLQSMDGKYVRLQLQDDGLLQAATVNWKHQATIGMLAPITPEARERLVEKGVADFEESVIENDQNHETGES